MPDYANPLTLKEMAKIINSADSYKRYQANKCQNKSILYNVTAEFRFKLFLM